jgi:hypothetical protein
MAIVRPEGLAKVKKKKVKLSMYQAAKAHRVVRH